MQKRENKVKKVAVVLDARGNIIIWGGGVSEDVIKFSVKTIRGPEERPRGEA